MIHVIMRSGEPKKFVYPEGEMTYTQDRWLYVIDDDGQILGCHPETNIQGVQIERQGGRTAMKGENTE
jgi:hypothetical protein